MATSHPTPTRATTISSVPDRVLSPTRSAAADARRAARREQMRDFYGLKRDGSQAGPNGGVSPSGAAPRAGAQGSGASSPGGSNSGHAAPTVSLAAAAGNLAPSSATRRDRKDLSSPNFVPAEYYEDLIARASLPELLKTTSTLATDIGRLHSSRHTLVYNHHHQLFSAGDTISVLNTRTPQLLSIVTDLQERFSQMSQLADSVALLDPSAVDDRVRARAVAQQGLERLRLMLVADESWERVRGAWGRVEDALKGREEGLEGLLEKGREIAGVDN